MSKPESYSYSGTKVKDFFLSQIDSGNTKPSLATNDQDGWQYYWTGYHGTGMNTAKYGICVYALNHTDWTLANGGPIRVEVEYDNDDHFVEARLLGWDLTETGTLTMPAGIKTISGESLRGINGTTVVIPDGCTSVGEYAFADSNVRTVTVPASLTSIDDHAFDHCGRILFILSNENEAVEGYAARKGFLTMAPD